MHERQKVEFMQAAHIGGHSKRYLFDYVYFLYNNFLYKKSFLHMQLAYSLKFE
jgi:hypothetical protein